MRYRIVHEPWQPESCQYCVEVFVEKLSGKERWSFVKFCATAQEAETYIRLRALPSRVIKEFDTEHLPPKTKL